MVKGGKNVDFQADGIFIDFQKAEKLTCILNLNSEMANRKKLLKTVGLVLIALWFSVIYRTQDHPVISGSESTDEN